MVAGGWLRMRIEAAALYSRAKHKLHYGNRAKSLLLMSVKVTKEIASNRGLSVFFSLFILPIIARANHVEWKLNGDVCVFFVIFLGTHLSIFAMSVPMSSCLIERKRARVCVCAFVRSVVLSASQNFIQWRYWCGKLIRLQNAVSYLLLCSNATRMNDRMYSDDCNSEYVCVLAIFGWAFPSRLFIANIFTCKTSYVRANRLHAPLMRPKSRE